MDTRSYEQTFCKTMKNMSQVTIIVGRRRLRYASMYDALHPFGRYLRIKRWDGILTAEMLAFARFVFFV